MTNKRTVLSWRSKAPERQPQFSVGSGEARLPVLATVSAYTPQFAGAAEDIVAQAKFLYGNKRPPTLAELAQFHASLGGTLSEAELQASLLAAGFCTEGGKLVPESASYGGLLWDQCHRAHQAVLFFDVGLGKTRAMLAALALACPQRIPRRAAGGQPRGAQRRGAQQRIHPGGPLLPGPPPHLLGVEEGA